MSDAFPPIPQPGSNPPPPPPHLTPPAPPMPAAPPPPYGGMPTPPPVYPPAGYTAYGGVSAGGPLRSVSGVRTATIVLFWVASAAAILLGLVAYQRGGTLDDYFAGNASLSDIEDADSQVAGVFLLVLLAQIAAAVLLAVWSHRTAGNAKSRGADVRPGLAAGGWFIPIGNYWVPWGQLRKAAGRFGTVPSSLGIWQALFIAQVVLSVIARAVVSDPDLGSIAEDAGGDFRNQGFLFIGTGIALALATIVATKAMKDVDALTTPSN